nr:hypothetical protein [Prosthecobacter debontii]
MTVHLLTGLGATSALYTGYEFPFLTNRVEYSRPSSLRWSFADYAQHLIETQNIQSGDSLIGVSLGGMLACEVSKRVSISKITLISSCTQRVHLRPLLSHLSFLGPHLPWLWLQRCACSVPGMSEARKLAVSMFRESDPVFVRWACSHAANWDGLIEHPDRVSIHGDRDSVFPIRRQIIQHLIPGGDHLMAITRRLEILPLLIERHGGNNH